MLYPKSDSPLEACIEPGCEELEDSAMPVVDLDINCLASVIGSEDLAECWINM